MWNWWPSKVPHQFIPALRSLGKKIRPHMKAVLNKQGREVTNWDYTSPLTKEEERTEEVTAPLQITLSKILCNGVKLFRLPANLQESLNETVIPLEVKDYSCPFEAQIVELPNGQFHYVYFNQEPKFLMISTCDDRGILDNISMMHANETIESYLGQNSHNWLTDTVEPGFTYHTFRATLNFLLLATLEGVMSEGKLPLAYPERKSQALKKIAQPELIAVQNIKLFKSAAITALESMPTDRSVRPHYRRSHWKHVACGVGRAERKLVLIPWVLVNKDKLTPDQDPGQTEYNAQP